MAEQVSKLTLSIGGAIAASLPSSIRAATSRLGELRAAQKADSVEAASLSRSLRTLSKDSTEYAQATDRVASLKTRIREREGEIVRLSLKTREATQAQTGLAGATQRVAQRFERAVPGLARVTQATSRLGVGLAGLGVTLGIAVAGVTALTKAITGAAARLETFYRLGRRGFAFEGLQRASLTLGTLLGSFDEGRRLVLAFTETVQGLREALAFNPGAIGAGQLRGLATLGLQLRDVTDLPVEAQLRLIADRTRGLSDSMLFAALQAAGFSRELGFAVRELQAGAEVDLSQFGVISPAAAQRARETRLAMSRLGESLRTSVTEAIVANSQEIQQLVSGLARLTGGAIRFLATNPALVKAIGVGLAGALGVATVGFGAMTAAAFAALVPIGAIGTVLLPVTAAILAVGTVIAAGLLIWRNWDRILSDVRERALAAKATFLDLTATVISSAARLSRALGPLSGLLGLASPGLTRTAEAARTEAQATRDQLTEVRQERRREAARGPVSVTQNITIDGARDPMLIGEEIARVGVRALAVTA